MSAHELEAPRTAGADRGFSPGLGLAAAGFGAALTILAFPPYGIWPLAFGMWAPLAFGLAGASPRAAFATAWVYTVAMALAISHWIPLPLMADFGISPLRAWTFTAGLIGVYALVPAAAVAVWAWTTRRWPGSVWAAAWRFAGIVALGEALRAGPLQFPWLLSGHALAPAPLFLQVADLGGVAAPTFLVVSIGAGLGLALARRDARCLALPVVGGLLCAGYGAFRLGEPVTRGRGVEIGVVQAAVLPSERFLPDSARRNVLRHLLATRTLLDTGPLDLVVWAETSVDAYLESEPGLMTGLQRFVDRTGTPLVTGAPRRRAPGVQTNSVVLFTPGAREPENYDKQRLVPFAEYDPPLSVWLEPLIGELASDEPFTPGHEATVLRRGPLPMAAPVCFEITYADEMRAFRRGGAALLLNLSNDAWFGPTGFARVHLGHAVFRAVELRSWIVRGANTGISAVIDPAGRIVAQLPAFEQGTLRATVYPAGPPPFFARFGAGPFLSALALGVLISLRASR